MKSIRSKEVRGYLLRMSIIALVLSMFLNGMLWMNYRYDRKELNKLVRLDIIASKQECIEDCTTNCIAEIIARFKGAGWIPEPLNDFPDFRLYHNYFDTKGTK